MINRRTLIGCGGAAAITMVLPASGRALAPARPAVMKPDAEWRRLLGPQRYRILRQAGTERAYSSPLNNEHRRGRFDCAGCGQRLFKSAWKFDSGTGWPSFFTVARGSVMERSDRSFLMERTEVLCARCGGHLGHVFRDGPKPTGLRYCMNGLALRFVPA